MVDPTLRQFAITTLAVCQSEIDGLLAGPAVPTAEYQAWLSSVKRALSAGLGPDNLFLRDLEAMTIVSVASVGTPGRPGSWSTAVAAKPPHEVLRQTRKLIADALSALGHSAPVAVPSTADVTTALSAGGGEGAEDDQVSRPMVLISYAWGDADLEKWVQSDLATRLRRNGVNARLDKWEIRLGYELPEFMESAIRDSDFVLVVCTPLYKTKSDNRQGGVGYEGSVMTGERMAGIADKGKFIPVLRAKDAAASVPTWLQGRAYSNLSDAPGTERYEREFENLLHHLLGFHEEAPPIGSPPPRPVRQP